MIEAITDHSHTKHEDKLLEFFLHHGSFQDIAGNKPFQLNNKDVVWYIEKGKIEIFSVNIENQEPAGARTHFLSRENGELIFGMDLDTFGMGFGFLAVGIIGTRVYQVPTHLLQKQAIDPQYAPLIANLLDSWIISISTRLTQDIVPHPTSDINFIDGSKGCLQKNKRGRSKKGVLWMDIESGDSLFIDMENLDIRGEEELFPLTHMTWIQASFPSKMELHVTTKVIAKEQTWTGLAKFHEMLCTCEFFNKRLLLVDEVNRLSGKKDYSEWSQQAALVDISSVLTEMPELLNNGNQLDDPVLLACRIVGEKLDIVVRDHPDLQGERELDVTEKLSAIAKSSQIRIRAVALRDDWYKYDMGPLVGTIEDSKDPVALIPTSPTSYECVNPVTKQRVVVNEDMAAKLAPFGACLYRTFKDGPLKPFDLIRFGMFGQKSDLKYLITMGLLVGFIGALTPFITGQVFDSVIPEAERGLLFQYMIALLVAAFATTAFTIVRNVAVLRIQGKMDYSIQAALWDRLLNLSSTFFRDYSAGDLADRVSGINQIRGLLAGAGIGAVLGSLSSIFFVILMFSYSFSLSFIAMGLTFAFILFSTIISLIQIRYQRHQLQIAGKITGLVLQLIGGVGKIRVSGAENHAFRRWTQDYVKHQKVSYKIGKISNVMMIFNSGFTIISSMVIYFSLVLLTGSPDGAAAGLSTGQFIAFSGAYAMFLGAMMALSNASVDLLRVVPIYERLKPIVTEPAEISEDRSHPGVLTGNIEVSHLHFRYQEDGPLIIKDVSFKIAPGEFVAFVGGSGSGKTTIMRLLMGFEKPEAGTIYYDDQDLASLDLREVRQQVGVVLQDSKLLPTDIFRNIVGTSSLTVEDAWEAAEMAGLAADVKQMSMGMHTMVSEGGGTFSGGQRQRLMIARAIVHKPRILFLDEATSALDNRTQAQVSESLDKMQATRIVIAHRLSTIINADKIYVLEKGEIIETGTYDELVKLDGFFAQLVKRQTM